MEFLKNIAKWILSEELELQRKINLNNILEIQNLRELVEMEREVEKLENYYNNKYPTIKRSYKKRFLSDDLNVDVRCFVGNYNNYRLPLFEGTEDEMAIEGLKWIVKNKGYKSDKLTTGLNEYWNFSFESKEKSYMDCEDGAILLYDILRANGIPAWKLRVTAGWAINPWNEQTDGHCYLTYYSEECKKWVSLDWCYFPNIEEMSNQPKYSEIGFYGEIWFSFNEDFCWGKDKWSN
jgi:hypothetical protein